MKKNFLNKRKIEAYLLGELSSYEMKKMEERIKKDISLQNIIQELKEKNRVFFDRFPYKSFEQDFNSKYKNRVPSEEQAIKKKAFQLPIRLLVPLSFAVILFVIFFFPNTNKKIADNTDIKKYETRIKGDNKRMNNKNILFIYRKKNNKIDLLNDKTPALEGDLIQLAYFSKNKYGMIFSIDGNSNITEHFPISKSSSYLLNKNKKTLLPIAYTLDDAPYYECFFFITSNKKLDKENISKKIISSLHSDNFPDNIKLNLPPENDITIITLIKQKNN